VVHRTGPAHNYGHASHGRVARRRQRAPPAATLPPPRARRSTRQPACRRKMPASADCDSVRPTQPRYPYGTTVSPPRVGSADVFPFAARLQKCGWARRALSDRTTSISGHASESRRWFRLLAALWSAGSLALPGPARSGPQADTTDRGQSAHQPVVDESLAPRALVGQLVSGLPPLCPPSHAYPPTGSPRRTPAEVLVGVTAIGCLSSCAKLATSRSSLASCTLPGLTSRRPGSCASWSSADTRSTRL
jgi:hypothetical protein